MTDQDAEREAFLDFLTAPIEAPAPITHCEHGVQIAGYLEDGVMVWDDCEPCRDAYDARETEAMRGYRDFPDDSRFFDEEAQQDLALHAALWPDGFGHRGII